MLFSEPKIPQLFQRAERAALRVKFQCSSASRKFLNSASLGSSALSVTCFSALQRAENSSIVRLWSVAVAQASFSALQRAENSSISRRLRPVHPLVRFSALQRAENSSICAVDGYDVFVDTPFQCSSASRKFLNTPACGNCRILRRFQCSSASRKFLNPLFPPKPVTSISVSVLFSEPKIPQCGAAARA